MLRNFIKIFARHFRKDLQFSFINLTGLSLGLAVVLLIFLYLHHDLSFDTWFDEGDRVYLAYEANYTEPGLIDSQKRFRLSPQQGISKSPYLPTPLGPAISSELPEIAASSRFNSWNGIFQLENGPLSKGIHFADPGFFNVLPFQFIEGNATSALDELHGMVITQSAAISFFGEAGVLGRTIQTDLGEESKTFTITGVVEDPHGNISFAFECITRIENRPYYKFHGENWNAFNCPLLVKLKEGVEVKAVNDKLTAFAGERYANSIERRRISNKLGENDRVLDFALYPLQWVHHSVDIGFQGHQNPMYNLILLLIGILILGIACLNFIILSISKSGSRRMEVGIRKVMGAKRGELFWQFQTESFLYVSISVFLSFGLMELLLPSFNQLSGLNLSANYPLQTFFAVAVIVLVLLVGFLSGAYPSTYLAGQLPVASLKRGSTLSVKKGLLKWLVVGQFTISMVLIFSTFTMNEQMQYVAEKDLGFDKENVLVLYTAQVRSAASPWQHYSTIKNELLQLPGVTMVTGTNAPFATGWSKYNYKIDGIEFDAITYLADEDYLSMLDIELIEGRNFMAGSEADQKYSVIINESLARQHGWANPIGKEINWYETDKPIRVIGMVEDYHFLSLENEIIPMFLFMQPEMEPFLYTMVKLAPGDPAPAIASIEEVWQELYPTTPLSWSFLDQNLQNNYQSYRQWIAYMQYATGFALFIGCLGLFGLTRIVTQNRTKEIGIRKVFGAGISDILLLLNKEIVWIVMISSMLGIPLALWAMNQWLAFFHFHISPGWGIAAFSFGLALLIALVTVSFQTMKTSLSNPVESLRHE